MPLAELFCLTEGPKSLADASYDERNNDTTRGKRVKQLSIDSKWKDISRLRDPNFMEWFREH